MAYVTDPYPDRWRSGEDWVGVRSWTIAPGEHFYLGLYVDTDKSGVYGDYTIGIVFNDRLGYQYQQDFELHVRRDVPSIRPGGLRQPQVDLSYVGDRKLRDSSGRVTYLESIKASPLSQRSE